MRGHIGKPTIGLGVRRTRRSISPRRPIYGIAPENIAAWHAKLDHRDAAQGDRIRLIEIGGRPYGPHLTPRQQQELRARNRERRRQRKAGRAR